jgi:hypothetical protein
MKEVKLTTEKFYRIYKRRHTQTAVDKGNIREKINNKIPILSEE